MIPVSHMAHAKVVFTLNFHFFTALEFSLSALLVRAQGCCLVLAPTPPLFPAPVQSKFINDPTNTCMRYTSHALSVSRTRKNPPGAKVSSPRAHSRFRKRRFADSFYEMSHNSISSGHSSSSESSVVEVVGDVLDVLEPVPASTPSAPSPRVSNS